MPAGRPPQLPPALSSRRAVLHFTSALPVGPQGSIKWAGVTAIGAPAWKSAYVDGGRPGKSLSCAGAPVTPLFPVSPRHVPRHRARGGHVGHVVGAACRVVPAYGLDLRRSGRTLSCLGRDSLRTASCGDLGERITWNRALHDLIRHGGASSCTPLAGSSLPSSCWAVLWHGARSTGPPLWAQARQLAHCRSTGARRDLVRGVRRSGSAWVSSARRQVSLMRMQTCHPRARPATPYR